MRALNNRQGAAALPSVPALRNLRRKLTAVHSGLLDVPGHCIYFEGDADIVGKLHNRPVHGLGYVEVNPYFEPETSIP